MQRFERDPQSELVRRYRRILRSAPAEATRFATGDRALRAGTARPAPAAAPTVAPSAGDRAPAANT